ncbi:hypothetical protein QZQ97_08695 [Serratia sp. root2]|uniref:hypothetical protein n=1 Tax=Serratia sp. root2 TaxID=3059676 RepID=UPI00288D5E56|nr:hypothetical protein [Serratia sp. root2]MDT3251013.1 hypothetical protein [Serratia sp. root2]
MNNPPYSLPHRLLLQRRYAPITPSDLIPMQGHIALPQVSGYKGTGEVIDPATHRPTGKRALAVMSQNSKPSIWLKPNWK